MKQSEITLRLACAVVAFVLLLVATGAGAQPPSLAQEPADPAREAALYQRVCDEGEATGCYNLGILYEHGRGVGMDAARAAALYQRALQHDAAIEKAIGAPVTSRREFSRGDTLRVLSEIYDNMPTEQPHQLPVTLQFVDERGQAVWSVRDTLANAPGNKHWTTFSFTRELSLKDFAPGRYLVRLEAGAPDSTAQSAAETVIVIK